MKDSLLVRLAGVCLVVLAVCMPQVVWAQATGEQEFVEPTDEQLELNDQALSQMNDGEYAKAASLLQESLHIGPLNITYLNIGRSYQMMDRCKDAREALQKVPSAPKVRSPAPDFVEKKARQYLAEIGESECAAELADEPVGTSLGPAPSSNRAIIGWASVGAGAALIGVGVVFQLQAAGLRNEVRDADADGDGLADSMTRSAALDKTQQANTFSTIALSTVVSGAIFAGVGGYLLSTAPTERASNFDLQVAPGGGQLVWTLRF